MNEITAERNTISIFADFPACFVLELKLSRDHSFFYSLKKTDIMEMLFVSDNNVNRGEGCYPIQSSPPYTYNLTRSKGSHIVTLSTAYSENQPWQLSKINKLHKVVIFYQQRKEIMFLSVRIFRYSDILVWFLGSYNATSPSD